MRRLAYLLVAFVAFLQVAGNGSVCSRFETISTGCCSTNCPAASPQAGRNCCQFSDSHASFQSAVPTSSASVPLDVESTVRSFFTTKRVAFRSRHRRLEPQAGSSPLSLLGSRQI